MRGAILVVLTVALLALGGTGHARAGAACSDPAPGGGAMRFADIGQITHVVTREGSLCMGDEDVWTFSTANVPIDQTVVVNLTEEAGNVTATVQRGPSGLVPLEPGVLYRTVVSTSENPMSFEIRITRTSDVPAAYLVGVSRSVSRTCEPSGEVTPKPGDTNCDGAVDALDALAIFQFDARLVLVIPCPSVAEAYLDGLLNALDGLLILQYDAGLVDQLLPGF